MDHDMISEIISHCQESEVAKFRLLNKDLNRRTHEFYFISRNLHRINYDFGYLVENCHLFKYKYRFVSGIKEEAQKENIISLMFLPNWRDVKLEACDTNHGVLLCVEQNKYKGGRLIPDYIICKPATKQYRIIPNPKTRYHTITTGLMVIHRSDRFRYKIVRVSEPMNNDRRKTKDGFYNLNCEVFDSDLFAWKLLDDLELPRHEFFKRSYKPVSSYSSLHWLTTGNNVIRFCMQTETWSVFSVPDGLVGDKCLSLVRYEEKLGLVTQDNLWILKNYTGTYWENIKGVNVTETKGREESLWFLSKDVVSIASNDRISLYNTENNTFRHLHEKKIKDCFIWYYESPREHFIPFYSNYDLVELYKDSNQHAKESTREERVNSIDTCF